MRDEIDRRLAPLRTEFPRSRWVQAQNLHLTLAFLGSTDPRAVPELVRALEGAADGHTAFEARIGATGSFGGRRRPLVAWLGLDRGGSPFRDLAEAVRRRVGIVEGERRRREEIHLTVARDASPDLVARLGDVVVAPLPAWRVASIELYRSHVGSGAPRYDELARVALTHAGARLAGTTEDGR